MRRPHGRRQRLSLLGPMVVVALTGLLSRLAGRCCTDRTAPTTGGRPIRNHGVPQ